MKYYSSKLMMLVCATAFSVTACSSSNSFSDPVDFDTPSVFSVGFLLNSLVAPYDQNLRQAYK